MVVLYLPGCSSYRLLQQKPVLCFAAITGYYALTVLLLTCYYIAKNNIGIAIVSSLLIGLVIITITNRYTFYS